MANWTRVVIKRAADDAAKWSQLQDSFEKAFMAGGAPKDAAMYSNRNMAGADLTFYFSPGAGRIFPDALKGQPCDRPAKQEIALLAGHQDALDPAWVERPD